MSKFIQLHTLTAYGPSNLNRDGDGAPKQAVMGGVNRLRISSQCLKRAWRTSEVFEAAVGKQIGIRTRRIGAEVEAHLTKKGVDAKKVKEVAAAITKLWGSGKEAVFLFSRNEFDAALAAAEKMASGELDNVTYDDILAPEDQDVDVALWGRMLANKPDYNVVASCQVSHAVTTHRAESADDYFTACDDRADVAGEEGSGAGHLNVREFGAGVFYTYINVDREQLLKNLKGRTKLADAAIEGVMRAATTVSPGGFQASFASRAFASYALVEMGDAQPRSLVDAFNKPVREADQLRGSVKALTNLRSKMTAVYGPSCASEVSFDLTGDKAVGSLNDIIETVRTSCAS